MCAGLVCVQWIVCYGQYGACVGLLLGLFVGVWFVCGFVLIFNAWMCCCDLPFWVWVGVSVCGLFCFRWCAAWFGGFVSVVMWSWIFVFCWFGCLLAKDFQDGSFMVWGFVGSC